MEFNPAESHIGTKRQHVDGFPDHTVRVLEKP
jgi:hypothetical protein